MWRCTVVEVGIRQLRDGLRRWLNAVERGDEVIVTERGKPVARITGRRARSRWNG